MTTTNLKLKHIRGELGRIPNFLNSEKEFQNPKFERVANHLAYKEKIRCIGVEHLNCIGGYFRIVN